jgi:deoxycytidine triphosphate deaminase
VKGVYGSTTFDVSINSNERITQVVFLPIRNEDRGSGDYVVDVNVSAGPITANVQTSFGGR